LDIFKTVEQSYDKMGEEYHAYRNNEKFNSQLEEFSKLLPDGGRVLDAGCGVGQPTAEFLAKRDFQVIGVDISNRMVELARRNVPNAEFKQANIAALEFEDEYFDGIICVYTLWHIPRTKHPSIIQNFYRMLGDGGILVLNTGVYESEGMSRFFGHPMLWSTNDPKKTLSSVKESGFDVIFEGALNLGGETQYWVFAKKVA
jgi:ubiquinone/menaquinone biosynthesis C-methylase UbiE